MLIDWFTVGAQLLNFLILIWLMKRFLYQPILNALDARERKISAELSDADHKKQEAQTERDEFLRKNQEFEQQRADLVKVATEEAKNERLRLLNEVRQEAEHLRVQRQEALKSEQQVLTTSVSRRTQAEVFAITRKTLADLADVSLEAQMVTIFIDKLRQNDTESQQQLAAFKSSTSPLLIRTTFELPPAQVAEIKQAVQEIFACEPQLQFEITPHLISGIELSCNGQKISWSISDYLAGLEKKLNELLQPHIADKPAAQPQPTSEPKADQDEH
jgi:F-type H+-transporting ATPase subunit b